MYISINYRLSQIPLLIIFFILCSPARSQEVFLVDSLKKAFFISKEDTTKVRILLQLGAVCSEEDIPHYSNSAILMIDKLMGIKKHQAYLSKLLYFKSMAFNNIAYYYSENGQVKEALDFYNKSLKLEEEINYKQGAAITCNDMGYIFKNHGLIKDALDFYTRSLKIREGIFDKTGTAESLGNLGHLYIEQGQYTEALDYFNRSLKIHEELKDRSGISISLNNIGKIYSEQLKLDQALGCFIKSLKIKEELNDNFGISLTLRNIGSVYEKKGDLDKALEYYQRSLQISEDAKINLGIPALLANISRIFLLQKKGALAENYAKKSLMASQKTKNVENLRNAEKSLSLADAYNNNFKGAFEHYQKYILYRDSITNAENKNNSVKQQMNYEFEKTLTAAKTEQDKKDLQTEEERQKKNIIIGSISVGLILLFILATVIFRSLRLNQKKNKIITEQKKIVENQKHLLEEKQREILDSIHYARRIQRALISSEKYIDKTIKRMKS